jgi:uroporphyrinogen decarboxylase
VRLDEAWALIGWQRPLQGNLDPVALLTPWEELRTRVDIVLERAARGKAQGGLSHIFNLGHGIFPNTPIENVQRLVEHVHEQTAVDK